MALASETRSISDFQRGLLRRSSSTPSSPVVEAVDFCRSKPRLVELERQLYSLANGSGNSKEVIKTCHSLFHDCDNVKGIFNVFCSCSWVDRYQDPVISQLFYELVSVQHDSHVGALLLAELEKACEELLKVLTHLGTPNTLQLNVISLLFSLSKLSALPSSHREAVQSYLEEIARALWPYSKPSAPNLWANDAFCDAQCDILKACGQFLEEKCPVNTERTFQMITGKVICGDTSNYSRFRLLEIQELRSSGWKFSEATVKYYKEAYLKFINQARKDMLLNDVKTSSKNGLIRMDSIGESKSPENIKPVTVLRISESELRKSYENLQQEEKDNVTNNKSSQLVDCTERLAKLNISDSVSNTSTANKSLNGTLLNENPFRNRPDLVKEMKSGDNKLKLSSCTEDADKLEDEFETGKDMIKQQLSHSNDLTEASAERAASPCNSDGSDDVFANSSSENISANRVLPALHRGDFKKPRRPFKSDSSLNSLNSSTESLATKTTATDSKESAFHKTTLTRCQSEVTTSNENRNIYPGLELKTHQVQTTVPFGISQDLNVVSKESNLVEQGHHTERSRENTREWKQPSGPDNSQEKQTGDASSPANTQNWRQKRLSFTSSTDDSESPEKNAESLVAENWSARKLTGTNSAMENKNGQSSVVQNWRERKLSETDSTLENKNGQSSVAQNWRERKLSATDSSLENNNCHISVAQNWRERKLSGTDKNINDNNSHHWRERQPLLDSKEPESSSYTGASSENWRQRKSDQQGDFWGSGSRHENWRDRKSISMDESKKEAFPLSGQRSKRHSTGDIQLERQDSNEKGKFSPGGGFGLPKPTGQDDDTSGDEAPKQEQHEIQMSEEESQGVRGWKLMEIKNETGCRIFHKRDKFVIEISGDPQQCKIAKQRVYSVIAASQEEFGALVPLSDELLEHLQTDGCSILAERLSLSSGATVKMINDTQLFISGHRNCVNLAKTQLTRIKVMLRYTDDPDVDCPSQEDKSEEKHKQVEELFAVLEGRPRKDSNTNQVPAGGFTRDFLLSCALSPAARQRPDDLSLDRTEDWVKQIVLVNMIRGEQAVLEQFAPKRGFGSRHPANWGVQDL